MSECGYPPQVERFRQAILALPGTAACSIGLKCLEDIDAKTVSLAGEFADLPQVAIYRTNGGRENELLVQVEIMFRQHRDGWVALEFLSWWVRDIARSGVAMQLRGLALPPEGYGRQLGRSLKFELEIFLINDTDNLDVILADMDRFAESLEENMRDYADAISNPVEPNETPEIW